MKKFWEHTFLEVDSMARKQTRKATQAGRLGKDSSTQSRSPIPSGGAELEEAATKKPSGLPSGYPTIPIREIKILRKGIRLSEDTPEEIKTLAEAIRMIVSGFVAKTLNSLPENLKARIYDFVSQRLEQE